MFERLALLYIRLQLTYRFRELFTTGIPPEKSERDEISNHY
jgi:hypothetical protein